MLHQLPPPTNTATIEPAQVASLSAPDSQLVAVNNTGNKNQPQSAGQSEKQVSPSKNSDAKKNLQLVAETPAKPTQPEKLPPEFTPQSNIYSAKALGEGLTISYPLEQDNTSNQSHQLTTTPQQDNTSNQSHQQATTTQQEKVAETIVKSRNLSQPQAEKLVKKLTKNQKQGDTNSKNSTTFPSSQPPVQVDFYTQNQQNTPSTIEFKSRAQLSDPLAPSNPTTRPIQIPVPTPKPQGQPQQGQPQQPTTTPNAPEETRRVVEIIADYQEYDEQRQVVTARGNVVVRFDGAVVDADQLQVNLDNLIAVGEGNVALTRGDQVLRGQRFTYNFVQDNGELERGSGEIFIPTAGTDLAFAPPGTPNTVGVQRRPLSDRLRQNQPLTGVGSPGGINVGVGGGADARNIASPTQGGQVRRVRFEAARVNFYPRGWEGRDVRLTNDPFSPPEVELRADKVTLTRETPQRDRVVTQGQRLVFDQRTTLPIPKNSQIIDRSERDATPLLASIGFDGDARGGVFVERSFEIVNTPTTRWSVTPQFFAQKAIAGTGSNFASLFGVRSRVNAVLSPQSRVEGTATFESLDLSRIEDSLRANLRYQQALGSQNPHILNLEYNYRDRLYNGTLGFQRVQSSFGGVLLSPIIPLGKSGLNLTYQASAQYINANTDRLDLLEPRRDNDRISLGRLQANARLFGGVPLWQGKGLPPTPTEGLRYTANPVVPYLSAFGELNGTTSYYSNGDNQNTLFVTAGLQGQIGNFSKPFLDYTGFNISYSQGLNTGLSPFLFDRSVDNKILNFGLVQQLYGPFRIGFQTSVNIDTGSSLSTEYTLEYSRRSYGITLRYNPVQELGGISFRLSDFNWTGGTDPFTDSSEIKPVVGGVEQR